MMNMDLNLFTVFVSIYETRNLTETARRLHKTQPAVSNALGRLRVEVGDPLFIHGGGKMNPTPVADELIGNVRQGVSLLQKSVVREPEFDPFQAKKSLRVSIGDIGEAVLLPPLYKALHEEAPNLTFQAYQVERRQMLRQLASNEVDFAVDIPLVYDDPDLRQVSLYSERQVCAVSKNHPLAQSDILELGDYLNAQHIHVSSRRRGGGVADIGLGKIGAKRDNVVRMQHYNGAFALLENSDLLLTVPYSLARLYECHYFDLPFEAPTLDLNLYWHSSSEQSAISRWVRARFIEIANKVAR
ncbi:LysR family transcriptional regulator [Sneathiella sp. P13V-1]|uniref:LysR family transcriptional regulator n=1 Tax=Sneathiella sp. P13V-1 TaxID=2697366 RepID=UPI00187B8034|nr:LysR family transcriptional regulator [Sneathiella sp. P13V-1]MBE7638443.1 LysR family transcriptional regulator [Sneathiella sp. P13V-1]